MKGLSVISTAAMLCFGVAVCAAPAVAQQKSLKDQLVGTWTLVSWELTRPDGSKSQNFGEHPKGISVFGADGRFVVMFARADLPKIAANERNKVTPEEAKALWIGSIAYFGTYTVDEASKTISYRIESTTFPNQLGREQKRVISALTADELKYTNPAATAGGKIEVAMKRAQPVGTVGQAPQQ